MRQIIIAIGREFGSGGHVIAKRLAEYYNIPLYHKEMLDELAKDGAYSKEVLERFDERPVNLSFIPIPIAGNTMSLEQEIAIKQFNFLRKKADEEKESFVVIGRCADEILADNPNLVRVFIMGDKESKTKRVMEREGITQKQAENKMKKMDKMRKTYHNFYCENKWGDSRGYDICINTGKIDFETAQKMIQSYVGGLH
ncbi:AAA family ATPase [uncultured Eubacterium sp.]|uniref:cytidylate kinase-like family protein n=1 Tax=uncultured Eubacterium sp. TaxID=165185 RepID=UPI0026732635|nr:cytidylate kinase-like family protein [uncultured Eubacterium sp.]